MTFPKEAVVDHAAQADAISKARNILVELQAPHGSSLEGNDKRKKFERLIEILNEFQIGLGDVGTSELVLQWIASDLGLDEEYTFY